ncbi:MAG: hypothetical protein EKK53_04175 [Burkholderiales bacterium]|nr:MAG: hypothetical protein EKK53_04175 [Burkholderiales bacterium]
MEPKPDIKDFFAKAEFDVEHALGMHARDFCILPAEGIYDKEAIASISDVADRCHIYLIGYTPRVNLGEVSSADGKLLLHFEILGKQYVLDYDLPEGLALLEEDGNYVLVDSEGRRYWPDQAEIQSRLSRESKAINFEVKYVGQAYGTEGSRSAIDRLLKHEKLQMIALKGAPEGYRITLLLLSIETSNRMFTVINPFAKNLSAGEDRIRQGLDKLFNTTEEERISLYEAALIRYFYPDFNKEFKDSFPSTNLKILRDCYDKDFSAVIAEICIDDLPFTLWSKTSGLKHYHIAKHDLHKEANRRAFFGL